MQKQLRDIEKRADVKPMFRDIEKFTDVEPMFQDSQKEKWKGQLQEIERKRTELLPEHQKMQDRSQKLQSLQDKNRNFHKEACACEEEMRKVGEEVEEKWVRFEALCKTLGNRWMAADDLEDEIQIFEGRGGRRQLCVAVQWML